MTTCDLFVSTGYPVTEAQLYGTYPTKATAEQAGRRYCRGVRAGVADRSAAYFTRATDLREREQ